VVPNGPGARGGLVQGDVITKVNGQQVTPDQTVSYLIANTPVGSRVPLEIIRGGKRATVYVQVGERPTEEALAKISGTNDNSPGDSSTGPATGQRVLGLSLAPLTPELARAANLPASARGVIVTAVDPNSNAGERGLQRGDLIVSVNNQPVVTPAQMIAAVETARRAGRSSVLLLVQRGNAAGLFVAIDIAGKYAGAELASAYPAAGAAALSLAAPANPHCFCSIGICLVIRVAFSA
jgi:serine protease Do